MIAREFGLAPGETKEKDSVVARLVGAGKLVSKDGRRILFQEAGEGGGPRIRSVCGTRIGSPAIRLGEGSGLWFVTRWEVGAGAIECDAAPFAALSNRRGRDRSNSKATH